MSSIPSILFSHNHHLLKIKGCDSPLDVLAFEGQESLSQPFEYRIELTSSDKHISPEQVLKQSASLTLQTQVDMGLGVKLAKPLRVVQGVVTRFEHLNTSADEARYAVTLKPRLALFSQSRHNAVYRNQSVPEIVEYILRERHDMRGQDFLFNLSYEYPVREQVIQYDEDDLSFVQRLLADVGIWFHFQTDTRLNIDVVNFYDSKKGYHGMAGHEDESPLVLPARTPSGMSNTGQDAVWSLTHDARVVTQSVSLHDYNYRDAAQDLNLDASAASNHAMHPTTYGQDYHDMPNYLTAGETQQPNSETGQFYAKLRHEQHLNGQTQLSGQSSSAEITLAHVLKVTGNDVQTDFSDGILITQISYSARRDATFQVHFQALPIKRDYCYRAQPLIQPKIAGTLPARVTSTKDNDIYGHIDKEGRYRISFLFDRATWKQGFESLWVRQARPYAGDTYGLHLPLLVGTEVAIAFEQGNPDRPYIIGVLHDSKHPDLVTIQNYKRNVLRTPSNNKIRLDDTREQEHIKVATEYGGKSQLNLGHLVDSERKERGHGFELRTDSWGAIRGGNGLFISADKQENANNQQLEMSAALSELQQAQVLTESLNHAVEAAKAELADLATQKSLLAETISELKQSALLLSAPEGIIQTTAKSIQHAAGENLITTSRGHTNVNALKHLTMAAGQSISLFAQKLGLKLFAGQGKVEIQAQSDEMALDAQKDMRLSSHEGQLVLSAKDEIILSSGGAYIRIGNGKIELGAPDKIISKSSLWQKLGAASYEENTKVFDKGSFKIEPQVVRAGTMQHVEGAKLDLSSSAGVMNSLTDAAGKGVEQSLLNVESVTARVSGGKV